MSADQERLPRLLRLQETYEPGPGSGPWLKESLGRAGSEGKEAQASVEFSLDPRRVCRVKEGPLEGREVRGLAADYGADLVGRDGLALLEQGLTLTARFVATDAGDGPLCLLRPAGETSKETPGPLEAVVIVEARPGATLYYGRRRDLPAERFNTLLLKSPGPDILEARPAETGRAFLAVPGLPYALGRGIMAFAMTREPAAGKGKAHGIISAPVSASRVFVPALGFVEGRNAVTWLYAAQGLAAARLDLRAEWEDEWKGEGARPGFALLTGLSGTALVSAEGETETIGRGVTLLVSACCRRFRVNPGPQGATILKTWLPDPETEILQPLMARGISRREALGLYGFFGRQHERD